MIEKGFTSTTPRFLQQYSPIRERQRRDKAIEMLADHHYLYESKADQATVLLLNPVVLDRMR